MSTTTEQPAAAEGQADELLNEQIWTGKIFSDGWVDAPETIEVTEPATGEVLGTAGAADAAAVARACKSAAAAQREWAQTPFIERVAVVRRAGRRWSATARRYWGGWSARADRSRPRPTTRSAPRSASSTWRRR